MNAVTTIEELDAYSGTHQTYLVSLYEDVIHTTVTISSTVVDTYISDILYIHRHRLNRLVVGLDVEWRPPFGPGTNPAATLQLCVGRKCLIFQLLHADCMPQSLITFLGNTNFQFVGVGVAGDANKLWSEYGLYVGNPVDLKDLVVEEMQRYDLRSAGLKRLAWEVLEMDIEKPKRVTLSNWDNEWLTYDQIKYACVDAFVSFEIGKTLLYGNY